MDVINATARQIAQSIRTGETTAADVVESHLARLRALQPHINAVVAEAPDALDQARAADADLAQGTLRGPLHGLPHLVKDLLPTKGMRTTFASPIFEHNVPQADALAVERVRAAGAIVLGKTNSPEFGYTAFTKNLLFGVSATSGIRAGRIAWRRSM